MKQIKEEREKIFKKLTNEELLSIRGGAWWEVRLEKDHIIWIYHPTDDDFPG